MLKWVFLLARFFVCDYLEPYLTLMFMEQNLRKIQSSEALCHVSYFIDTIHLTLTAVA